MNITNLCTPLTQGTSIVSVAAGILFGAIGVRCVVAPVGGARFFGVPVNDTGGRSFVQAMGARNFGLGLAAMALVAAGSRACLVALLGLGAAVLMAAVDAAIVWRASGVTSSAKHIAHVPAFALFALWIASGRQATTAAGSEGRPMGRETTMSGPRSRCAKGVI